MTFLFDDSTVRMLTLRCGYVWTFLLEVKGTQINLFQGQTLVKIHFVLYVHLEVY